MEKVKLPREVAEAIEKLRRNGWKEDDLLNSVEFINEEHDSVIPADHMGFPVVEFLRKRNFVKYASAIVNGYEIEETPEDKVRQYYSDLTVRGKEKDDWDKFGVNLHRSEMQGIINTLKLLNIKIEGVNA